MGTLELYTLDGANQPDKVIEDYSSLVWTERYQGGDFTLVTNNVERTMNQIPLECRLTLRDTRQVAIAEVYQIEEKIDSPPTLTITGRMFESVFDRRPALKQTLAGELVTALTVTAKSPAEAAYKLIDNVLVTDPFAPEDVFDNVYYTATPLNTTFDVEYNIERKNLLEVVMGLLSQTIHGDDEHESVTLPPSGIRSIRPNQNGSDIGIDIYVGVDRSQTVAIDARMGQFTSARYVLSQAPGSNVAYALASDGFSIVNRVTPTPRSFDRRVSVFDYSSDETVNAANMLTRVQKDLGSLNPTAYFDGQIPDQIAMRYNVDYRLGDVISLIGNYGLSRKVRVMEFIRSLDNTGYKAYPTFQAQETEEP